MRNSEQGSALVYILIAIALLAALTVSFLSPSSQQTSSQSGFRIMTALSSQISLIQSAVTECRINYKKGDKSIDTTGTGSDPDARTNYPIKPNSTHYTTATIGPTAGRLVKDIRCPGNPGGNNINHVKIFGTVSGKFLPAAPDLFDDWEYYNGEDGVFFWTKTNKSDAFLATALQKLDDEYGECEADIVDATGAAVTLDSNAAISCTNGYKCFRVRLTIKATAVYNGDTDGEEAACP
ncbi:MAG: hypothetical protein OEY94_04005 [Alphaproteobacteria bacterium]|nr:hypothetical protein [Alphaproteobacteria bacterium]